MQAQFSFDSLIPLKWLQKPKTLRDQGSPWTLPDVFSGSTRRSLHCPGAIFSTTATTAGAAYPSVWLK